MISWMQHEASPLDFPGALSIRQQRKQRMGEVMAAHATELRGKRIALIGMGVESAALARFAAREGAASITATDTRSAVQLAGIMASVADLAVPVRLVAGGNPPEAWADADVIFVSPGITPGFTIGIPGITEAAARARSSRIIPNCCLSVHQHPSLASRAAQAKRPPRPCSARCSRRGVDDGC